MVKLTINFIGAGRLGQSIAKLITDEEIGTIVGVCNSTIESSQKAIDFIQQGIPYPTIHNLPAADLTFITVPDDKIETICYSLSHSKKFNSAGIVVHCSGLLTSDILSHVKNKGAYIASVHPMRSFADSKSSVQEFNGTYCAVEGDIQAAVLLKAIFTKMGAKMIDIPKYRKATYHVAGVMASNYLVTLAHHAFECLVESGIDKENAVDITLNIMQGTLNNIAKMRSPMASLTGPIKRGDVETIKTHIASFEDKIIKEIYIALGLSTIKLTTHSDQRKKMMIEALENNTE